MSVLTHIDVYCGHTIYDIFSVVGSTQNIAYICMQAFQ